MSNILSNQHTVIQIGLGPLGISMINSLLQSQLKVLGAVDSDESKHQKNLGINMTTQWEELVANQKVDVAILCTVSSLEKISEQIFPLLEKKISVISTCEELVYPWKTKNILAHKLDQVAKKNGVKILATGVNPGMLMDYLPIVVTGLSSQVEAIKIERIQNASNRRLPFQQKIGAGLSLEEFNQKVKEKKLRHVGLTESMHMIAEALGWNIDQEEETIKPIMGEKSCLGVIQEARAFEKGKEIIHLYFRAALEEENPKEEISILGKPNFRLQIPGGINGDQATCAIVINSLFRFMNLSPGLKTMLDLPPLPPKNFGPIK